MKKLFKIVGFVLLALVLAMLIAPAFLDPRWQVEESISIAAGPEEIFPYVAEMKRWEEWTPWKDGGEENTLSFDGPAQGVGAILRWESSMSSGELEVTEFEANSRVVYKIHMENGVGFSEGSLILTPDGDTTRVTWLDKGHFLADEKPIVDGISGYFARLPATLLQTTLRGGLAQALEDLKTQVEEQGA